jgi:hypothetical protein
VASLYVLHSPLLLALVSVVVGTFPPGIIPVVLGRVRDLDPFSVQRQDRAWSRATTVFAASQATAGYAYSAIFSATHGDHRLLFLIAGLGIFLGLVIDFVAIAEREAKRAVTTRLQ